MKRNKMGKNGSYQKLKPENEKLNKVKIELKKKF